MRKRKLVYLSVLLVTASVLLGACATKAKPIEKAASVQPAPEAEASTIQAEASGLSPTGDPRFRTIEFAVLFGSRDSVTTWSFSIIDPKSKNAVKSIKGDASTLPERMIWDGKNDSGSMAPEGTYVANLAIEYGDKFKPGKASSKSFILDISPPTATFSPNPAVFAYAPNGVLWPIDISLSVRPGLAKAVRWDVAIFDAAGNQVQALGGTLPASKFVWEGRTAEGKYLGTGNSYPAVLTISDEYGNRGVAKGSFQVADIPGAESSAIAPRRAGFSPTTTSIKNTIDLILGFGSRANVESWQVKIFNASKGLVRTLSGTKDSMPKYVQWDGKDDSGATVAEGAYYAVFSLDYGKVFKPTSVQSKSFSLVTTAPAGSVTVDPPSVALSELSSKKPITFTVQAKSSYAQIAKWSLSISDLSGRGIAVFNANWPNNKTQWDGATADGAPLVPNTRYDVQAKVQDEYGNIGTLKGDLQIEGLPAATEPSSIAASSTGFAPRGDHSDDSIAFPFTIGNLGSMASWKITIVNESGIVARVFPGTKAVPASISWDGMTDGKAYAPEGKYTAVLAIDYGFNYAPVSISSSPFVLDLTPPTGKVILSTDLFSPDGDGTNDTISIGVTASSAFARIADWSITVLDPGNNPFMSWKGNWPLGSAIAWDGKGASGDSVESASDYPVILRLRDEYGNVSETHATISTDILVFKTGEEYRIRVPSIVFKPFTADFKDVAPDVAGRNLNTLDLLASKLEKFPGYRIRLEGHAVMINWDNKAKGEAEQKAVLIPLSTARAEAIKAALVERGLSADTIVTIGVGAEDPLVPDSDYANRWKNRRVEFYLLK